MKVPFDLIEGFGRVARKRPLFVIGVWIVLAGVLNIAVPQISSVASNHSADFIPRDAPAVRALQNMGITFHESTSSGSAYVVLNRAGGLNDTDRAYYGKLIGALRHDTAHVQSVQDLWGNPTTAPAALSADKTTTYALVRLVGDSGTSASIASVNSIRATIDRLAHPPDLTVLTTGPAATISDEFSGIESSLPFVTALTVLCIMLVLFAVYRSPAAVAIPLATIGLALAVSNGTAAFLGMHGMPLSIFSVSLLSAIVLGAGTDYAIFLISRYHEARRTGAAPTDAMTTSFPRIASVILASGLVVTLTCAGMSVTRIGLFRTVGLPCAIGVFVTLLAALTLTPAMIALAIRLGMLEPRKQSGRSRYWRWIAVRTVRRPGRALAFSLGGLILLAAVIPTIHLSYDERQAQRATTDSNRGYDIVAKHYHGNILLPEYVTVTADHDLRNTKDFAALESMSAAVAKVPGVVSVQSISRPLGETIPESSLGYQAGVVADGLSGGVVQLAAAQPQIHELTDGTGRLADGARVLHAGSQQLSAGMKQAVAGSGQLVNGDVQLDNGLTAARSGTKQLRDGADQLTKGSRQLADGVGQALAFLNTPQSNLAALRQQTAATPDCDAQPMCAASKSLLAFLDSTPAGQALTNAERLQNGVQQVADGNRRLADGLAQLDDGLTRASDGTGALLAGQRRLDTGLRQLDAGADQLVAGSGQLADGSTRVDDGVNLMTSQLSRLQTGLKTASDYLSELRRNTAAGNTGGFYIPQWAMSRPDLQTAIGLFISPDGRMARMIVTDSGDPFSTKAMDRTGTMLNTARQAVRGTDLRGSAVEITGLTPTYRDLRSMALRDFATIVVLASVLALLVIAALMRSLVVPLYVVGSAILSFGAALGLSVAVWQHLLHQPLHWAVPSLAFIILVAVAADYNVLLTSRVRDRMLQSRTGLRGSPRSSIIQAVTSTGGVITTAGAVFAITMLALTAAAVGNTAQVGFTIGLGLIIDTMVVRTIVVPAIAAVLGPRNWWPVVRGRPKSGEPLRSSVDDSSGDDDKACVT
ncbi:MMPL/RND family transporter [Nocardia miyunensis]|uniref:MMPL/RND family transporter n=1 Tax=Nocardia miyunensis TaxID=282684 RepID=UPI000833F321|nr:RND family transporter [Nocardia miyunensis]